MRLLAQPCAPVASTATLSVLFVLCALGAALYFQGEGLRPYAVSLALLALIFTMAARHRGASETLSIGSAGILLGVFVCWAVLSLAWSPISYLTTINVGMFCGAFVLYAITRLSLVNHTGERLLALALTGLGLLVAVMIMLEAAAGMTPTATFLNPNTAAAFVNLFWPIPAVLAVRSDTRAIRLLLLGFVAFMVFAVTVNGGRGAAIAALTVLALVALGVWRSGCPRTRVIALVSVAGLSMLAANLVAATSVMGTRGGVWGRVLETASDPLSSGMSRWTIWQGAWDMIQASPLLGHGPGTFFQIYPAYRLPADGSAGFHVHNDYLQFWLELGLPGLLLVLAIGAVCMHRVWRVLIARGTADSVTPSFVMATAGLGGLAVHSLVTYNLQVMVFILVCGIGLAFIDEAQSPDKRIGVRMRSIRTRPIRAFALYGLLALALVKLSSMTMAHRAIESGRAHSTAQDFSRAMEDFNRAQRLWNAAEPAWTAQSIAYQRVLAILPEDQHGLRESAKTAGLAVANAAEQRNPYRADLHTVMAELHLASPDTDPEAAEQAFREALRLDPRAIGPRLGLARLERNRSGPDAARRVIEAGLRAYGSRPPRVLIKVRSALTVDGV